jgi:hypothetical protein
VDAIAWIAIGLVIFNWIAAGILVAIDRRHPGITSLGERTQTQIVLALLATLVGVLGANRLHVLGFSISNVAAIGILVICLLALSIPAVRWLYLYWRGRF